VARINLENWGLKPSRSSLRHQMTLFGVKIFKNSLQSLDVVLYTKMSPMILKSPQLDFIYGSYASRKS
jgi:hypothetical protein